MTSPSQNASLFNHVRRIAAKRWKFRRRPRSWYYHAMRFSGTGRPGVYLSAANDQHMSCRFETRTMLSARLKAWALNVTHRKAQQWAGRREIRACHWCGEPTWMLVCEACAGDEKAGSDGPEEVRL